MLLAYSSTPMTCEKILTVLGVDFKDYGIPFDTMARAMDRDHQDGSAPVKSRWDRMRSFEFTEAI
jgi:cytochrome P450